MTAKENSEYNAYYFIFGYQAAIEAAIITAQVRGNKDTEQDLKNHLQYFQCSKMQERLRRAIAKHTKELEKTPEKVCDFDK